MTIYNLILFLLKINFTKPCFRTPALTEIRDYSLFLGTILFKRDSSHSSGNKKALHCFGGIYVRPAFRAGINQLILRIGSLEWLAVQYGWPIIPFTSLNLV